MNDYELSKTTAFYYNEISKLVRKICVLCLVVSVLLPEVIDKMVKILEELNDKS